MMASVPLLSLYLALLLLLSLPRRHQCQDPPSVFPATCSAASYTNWTNIVYTGQLSGDPKFWRYQTQTFFAISNGLALELAVAFCKHKFQLLFEFKAGRSGPVQIKNVYDAICSSYCVESDRLHQDAMTYTGCDCLELSTPQNSSLFTNEGDWCKHNSARMMCDMVGYCGVWGCRLSDFMCPRYEFNKKYVDLRGYGNCAIAAAFSISRGSLSLVLVAFIVTVTTMYTCGADKMFTSNSDRPKVRLANYRAPSEN